MRISSDDKNVQIAALGALLGLIGLIAGSLAGPAIAHRPEVPSACGLWVIGPMMGGACLGAVIGSTMGAAIGWLVPPPKP